MLEIDFQYIQTAVEKELSCSAHSMDHVLRVYNLALRLAKGEEVDQDVIKAAVLLHDIARVKEDNDPSGKTDHALLSAEMAEPILRDAGFPEAKIIYVQDCIRTHRYRQGRKPASLEAEIIFDADKLDAVGAIGIARAFVWVGRNNANIYKTHDVERYIAENLNGKIDGIIKDKTKHSPQLEYEIKIKFHMEKMHTNKAKAICKERLDFFKDFLDRLDKEIKGEI